MTQLKNYLKELRSIGAIKILPKQLSNEEAVSLNKFSQKTYRAGQITGKQWVLNNPDYWAIETSLSSANNSDLQSSPKDRFPTCRQNQASDTPSIGESTAKVLQLEGSANIKPLLQDNEVTKNSSGSTDYIFPKQLKPEERELAKPQLDSIDPILGQAVLDELAARLNANKVTGAPLSYLRSLISRAKVGQFTPEAGVRVVLAREQALAQKAKVQSSTMTPTDPKDLPKYLTAMYKALGRKQQPEEQE